MVCQAAFPLMAFGEPGRRGLTLHLTGGPSVSIECSTLCLMFLKSGFKSDGNSLIMSAYFCGVCCGLLSFSGRMDWMAATWKWSQLEDESLDGAEVDDDDGGGQETDATFWMRGNDPFGILMNCSNP